MAIGEAVGVAGITVGGTGEGWVNEPCCTPPIMASVAIAPFVDAGLRQAVADHLTAIAEEVKMAQATTMTSSATRRMGPR